MPVWWVWQESVPAMGLTSLDQRQPGSKTPRPGEFVEVDPRRRLVFTWGWTNNDAVPPGSTRVVVTLEAEDGGTRVVLRHHDLPDDEQRSHHRMGREMYLGRLGVSVLGGNPGPDPNTES
jgi:uncharacterized protein YndB with AHSA1/START domain